MAAPTKSHGRIAVRPTLTPKPLMEQEEIAHVWTARILTLFPGMFPGPLGESLIGRP